MFDASLSMCNQQVTSAFLLPVWQHSMTFSGTLLPSLALEARSVRRPRLRRKGNGLFIG